MERKEYIKHKISKLDTFKVGKRFDATVEAANELLESDSEVTSDVELVSSMREQIHMYRYLMAAKKADYAVL